jgi:hypothetical protein
MSDENGEMLSYLRHEVNNRLNLATGYADLREEEVDMEALDDFEESYERFERVLYETGNFDDILMERMDEVDVGDDEIQAYVDSALHSINAVEYFFSDREETRPVNEVFSTVGKHGEVRYREGVGEELVDDSYSAVVSTKICDYLKHARPEADTMFAVIGYEGDDSMVAWIGDDGEGLESGVENTGKGTEIIEEALGEGASYEVFTVPEIDEMELPELPVPEEDVGGLFRLEASLES